MSLGDLVVSLTAETAQFKDALTKATYQLDQSVGQMKGSIDGLQRSLAGVDSQLGAFGISLRNVFGLAAAGGFASLIASSIESAAHIQHLSEQTGILAGELAAMRPAANATSTSLDQVAQASAKFSKALETGNEDSGNAAKALNALGLSMEDLKTHSPAEQLHMVAERFNDFADGSGKAAAAQLLFGKSGYEILPFLKEYGQQIELVKAGYGDYSAQAQEFERSLGKLRAASQAITAHYAQELLPALKGVVDGFLAMNGTKSDTLDFMTVLGEGVRALALGFATVWTAIKDLVTLLIGGMKMAWASLKGDMAGVAEAAAETRKKLGDNADALLAFSEKALTGSKWFHDTADSIGQIGKASEDSKKKLYLNADAMKAAEQAAATLKKTIDDLNGVDQTYLTRLTVLKDALDRGAISQADYAKYVTQTIYAQKDVVKWAQDAQKAQDAANKTLEKAVDDVVKFHDGLQKQIEQVGLSADAIQKLDAREKDLGDTEDANIDRLRSIKDRLAEQQRALQDAISDWNNYAKSLQQAYEASNATLEQWAKGNDQLKEQIRNLGLTKTQVELLAAADEYERDVNKAALKEDTQERENYLTALKAQYQERIALINSKDERQAYFDAAAAQQKAFEDSSKNIESALEGAFSSGFKKGESLGQILRDSLDKMFRTLILRPILQPIAQGLSGMYQQLLGGGGSGSLFSSALGSVFGGAGGGLDLSGLGNLSQLFGMGGGSIFSAPAGVSWAMPEGLGTTTTLGGFGSSLGAVGLGAAAGGYLFSQFGAHSSTAGALAGAGAVVGLAGASGAVAAGAAAVASAAGATAATAATIAAAVPVVGWIVAAAALLYNIFGSSGGGPKQGGSALAALDASGALSTSRGDFFTPNDSDAKLSELVSGISRSYAATVTALGGVAQAASFGIGFDTDPQGTAQNRISTAVTLGGQQVYGFHDLNVGRDADALQARLNVEAQRMLLAAVQASSLPEDVAHLIDAFKPADLGTEQIQNLLTYAQVFHTLPQQMKDALAAVSGINVTAAQAANLAAFGAALGGVIEIASRDPAKDAQSLIDAANQTALQKLNAQGDALRTLAEQFDGSAAAAVNLAQATATYYQNVVQLVAALEQSSAQFHQSIEEAQRSIQFDMVGQSPAEQIKFYQNEIAQDMAKLADAQAHPATADPATIMALANQAKTDYQAWFGLLSKGTMDQYGNSITPNLQMEQGSTFLGYLDSLDKAVTAANQAVADNLKAQNDPNNPNSPIGSVKSAFDQFMGNMNDWLDKNNTVSQAQASAAQQQLDAASAQQSAAATQLTAAQTPINVVVTSATSGEVTAGG